MRVALVALWLIGVVTAKEPSPPAEPPELVKPEPASPHYDLEELLAARDLKEGLTRANVRARTTPDDPTLLWMKARFMYDLGEIIAEEAAPDFDRTAWYAEMLDAAKSAVRLAPNDPHTRWWRGIAQAQVGLDQGLLQSLMNANQVRRDFEAAAEAEGLAYSTLDGSHVLPCDAYNALGVFYRMVPERAIARALTRTKGGMAQSLAYQEMAVACGPHKLHYWKELGITQICIGQREGDTEMLGRGFATLQRMLAMPAKNRLEEIDQRHTRRLMADPSLACTYNRSMPQDMEAAAAD